MSRLPPMRRLPGGTWRVTVCWIAAALAAPAWADGNVKTGGWLSRAWCENCHGREKGVASDAVPSLPAIALQSHDSEAWLRAWLSDPHPPMPNLTLSRSEIDDIVAYLKTLPAD